MIRKRKDKQNGKFKKKSLQIKESRAWKQKKREKSWSDNKKEKE